jgi:3-oxoacyl-[acyl-carrier protein] reductase
VFAVTTDTTPVLVVTGAGSGIGRAVAQALATRPETLVLVGRRRTALDETAASVETSAPPLLTDADLSTPVGAERLAAVVGDRPVAGLALVAGGVGTSSEQSGLAGLAESWESSWRTNVLTAVLTVEALRDRLADGAAVVAFGSIAATRGGGGYGAAKAALTPWARDLARTLGPRGVTVNVVAPGYTEDTEFFGESMTTDRRERLLGETFTGRPGTPYDVAALVAYLMSPAGRHLSGQVLHVNGGALLAG